MVSGSMIVCTSFSCALFVITSHWWPVCMLCQMKRTRLSAQRNTFITFQALCPRYKAFGSHVKIGHARPRTNLTQLSQRIASSIAIYQHYQSESAISSSPMSRTIPHRLDASGLASHIALPSDGDAAEEEDIDIMLDLPTENSDFLDNDHAPPATINAEGDENLGETMPVKHQSDAKCVTPLALFLE